ncbi:MAG: hypothetical protein P1P76_02090 [Anaerolineales bacterium]|nr:hypothetical protein [Anaerolineales bacterium]
MRLFEILTLLLLSINVIWISLDRKRRALHTILVWIGALMPVLQIILEGPRWQMIPAYALTAIVLIAWLMGRGLDRSEKRPPALRWGMRSLLFLILIISISLPVILPVPGLQAPGGEYAVGTTTLHLIDHDRNDPYAPDPSMARELLVQVWYPAEAGGSAEYAPWMESAAIVAPRIAAWLDLPSFFLNHLRLAESNALLDARALDSAAPYPVLLFSHGYGGFRAQNTNQAQELASHGFIVFAVEHTYGAVVTVFPDGRVADHNPDTLPDGLSDQESLEATRALGEQWARDLGFALHTIDDLNDGQPVDIFHGLIDTASVGVYGHSTGGGAAIEFCTQDQRCDAVLTMDPYMKPVSAQSLETGLSVPALHMFSEGWPSEENMSRFDVFAQASAGRLMSITIAGTEHYDFSDLPLLTPLAHTIGLKGPLPGPRVIEILNTLSVSFFEQTLMIPVGPGYTLPLEHFPEVSLFP